MNALQSRLNNKGQYLAVVIVSILWCILIYEAFYSAAIIWIGNEIFNHCLIVIPASCYLVWEKRKKIVWRDSHYSKWALPLFIVQLLLFLLGVAGDIQLFKHVATFTMLPTLVWFFVGDKIAWQLKFPLAFIVFAVPVGEQLVPFLQEVTADLSVYLLELSGIPLFRSGLFIEIPQGKFLVAEACSGISFLIAAIVLGNLYAYMNLKTMRRRILFVLLLIIVPILANAVRVYGIIIVGYLSDMEHAVGADHLIYGWFFFAFVLVILFMIGELIRIRELKALGIAKRVTSDLDQTQASSLPNENSSPPSMTAHSDKTKPTSKTLLWIICGLMAISIWQKHRMTQLDSYEQIYPEFVIDLPIAKRTTNQIKWQPAMNEPSSEYLETHLLNGQVFDAYYAYFDGSKGELISSLHRLYLQDRWTLKKRRRVLVDGKVIINDLVASSTGATRNIYYFYVVDGKWFASQREAKFQQVLQTLRGKQSQGAIFGVSMLADESKEKNVDEVLAFIAEYASKFSLGKAQVQ